MEVEMKIRGLMMDPVTNMPIVILKDSGSDSVLPIWVGIYKVVVTELREDTFYAVIWMEREGRVISIDSRPSDALALALRVDCPIYVEDEVLKNSKLATSASDRLTSEELRKYLEGLNDEDMGRYKM
jgi:bifunctional DNase/RNase